MSFLLTFRTSVCVGLWFASERWTFAKTKGKRWLLDILEDHTNKAAKVTGVGPAKRSASRAATMGVERTRTLFSNLSRSFTDTKHRVTGVTGRMAEAMVSMANVPRVVFARTVSSLAIVTDGLSTNQGDAESQDGNMRTDSPVMYTADNGSGNLGINGYTEKRKLSDLGKGIEFAIPEDKPLHLNTQTPLFTTSPPSAGENSGTSGSDSAPGDTSTAIPAPAGPVLPRNARFKAVAKKVSTTVRVRHTC